MSETSVTVRCGAEAYSPSVHGPAHSTDASSPSTGADIALALSLLLILLGLAAGLVWSQQASTAGASWRGAVPPLVTGMASWTLLRVRAAYPELPKLRRLVTRVAWTGLVGATALVAVLLLTF